MQFSVQITYEFLKKSRARRLFKNWPRMALALALIIVALGLEVSHGIWSWRSTVSVTMLGIAILIYAVAWNLQLKQVRSWVSRQNALPVTYRLSADSLSAVSNLGSTELKWANFKELVITDFDIHLVFLENGALTLPTKQISPEVLAYLKDRFTSANRPVKISQ